MKDGIDWTSPFEFKATFEQAIYAPKPKYEVRFEFPKPWWKPQFIHNRQVSKLIKQIKAEMEQ